MHGQVRRAGLRKGFEITFGLFDHQVHVERQFGGALVGLHQERAHGDVGDEVAVHHVHMDPTRAGSFERFDVLAQAQVIRRDDGGGDDVFRHGRFPRCKDVKLEAS